MHIMENVAYYIQTIGLIKKKMLLRCNFTYVENHCKKPEHNWTSVKLNEGTYCIMAIKMTCRGSTSWRIDNMEEDGLI